MADTTTLLESTRTLDGTEYVRLATTGANWKALVSSLANFNREKLSADRTYYVRTDGSDSNDGLTNTAGGAFLTFQGALDHAVSSIDAAGHAITFLAGQAGQTWAGVVFSADIPNNSAITFDWNNGTVSTSGGTACFRCSAFFGGTGITLTNVTFIQTGSGNAIHHAGNNAIAGTNITFGGVNQANCYSSGFGYTILTGAIAITGDSAYHLFAANSASECFDYTTTTFTGVRNFTTYALCNFAGLIDSASTFAGTFATVTGKRYDVSQNGVINTGGAGANYFPGNVAGTTASGGQYT